MNSQRRESRSQERGTETEQAISATTAYATVPLPFTAEQATQRRIYAGRLMCRVEHGDTDAERATAKTELDAILADLERYDSTLESNQRAARVSCSPSLSLPVDDKPQSRHVTVDPELLASLQAFYYE